MDNNDCVQNDETLYRSVKGDEQSGEYRYKGGQLEIRSKAFLERTQKPSVDRAKLRGCDPSLSRLDETQGVVSFNVATIRAIRLNFHTVDVMPDPLPNNCAHALITMVPKHCVETDLRDKDFRALRYALADIATENGWTLPPPQQ